ncbi:MAG: DedA family protein [Verrucomicrobia bacterium]|nr:MAG: DedA family protein [Verrucomicrobiota bacterium]PYJ93374.1 MAG: DedA family protein [Verrucomicrobiota bacterium]PYK35525.1 MAG: DedA family protein [Verrucomicrobiota bacterium]PYL21321.1 MAG: DedA family protein [Verrucomicrobiota bacterium]
MHHFLQIWFGWVLSGGYVGIIVLMAMGSTPLPVPAEAVLPPAAFLAAQGRLNPVGVILAGTLGAYLGAALMYWISRWIGRPLVLQFGRFILLTPNKLEHAEHWLNRYEAGGVFFARVLPVVRHLISIPAGIVRMNFVVFSLVTILGSAISCSILAYLGHRAYLVEPELLTNPEAMVHFIRGQSRGILLVVTLFAALYMLTLRLMKPRSGSRS